MASYTIRTIKTLFARSGNRCTFPECREIVAENDDHIKVHICHIKASNPGGPRYDATQSAKERDDVANLILLCPNHHNEIDGRPQLYTVEAIYKMKKAAEDSYGREERASDTEYARALIKTQTPISVAAEHSNVAINSPGTIQANTIILKTPRKSMQIAAAAGMVGADGDAMAYVKYLIDRYNKFAQGEPTRARKFSHAAIYTTIKSQFGCQWQHIPMSRFDDICEYLEIRISRTRVAKSSIAKGQAIYSSFENYLVKHRQ
jgi:hypothetical protein